MILHLDMDAFFASVEQLDNPSYQGKPVVVGGLSGRGVVAAASYEARVFGIRSAMPMYQAKEKCPQAVFVSPRKHRYKEISKEIMEALHSFTPLVEPVSIDEAYIDISGCEKLYGPPVRIASTIKDRIKSMVNLTCSVGGAPIKFLSKIASDMDKPDGLTIIYPSEMRTFIDNLPIRKVPGVGKAKLPEMAMMGIQTLGDVKKFSEERLIKRFGVFGARLRQLANGVDANTVTAEISHKSVSSEETLLTDTKDKERIRHYIFEHAEDVGRQLRKLRCKAKTITLKLKFTDFKSITRSVTISPATQSTDVISKEAVGLLTALQLRAKIRLVGVGASGLIDEDSPFQMELFENEGTPCAKKARLEKVLDVITEKYGDRMIHRAGLKE